MVIQLPLPARWARLESRRSDPRGRLDALRQDLVPTKAIIRDALDALAALHGIPPTDIAYAVEGYVDDMLSAAIYNVDVGSSES